FQGQEESNNEEGPGRAREQALTTSASAKGSAHPRSLLHSAICSSSNHRNWQK
ncbi:hypothetical protein NDU88_008305, partial [Pleurodeles waltl]